MLPLLLGLLLFPAPLAGDAAPFLAVPPAAAPVPASTGSEIEVEGVVEARTEGSVTVGGYVFVVSEGTRLLDDDGDPVPFSAFQVGVLVEAEGHARSDGTVSAEKIKLDDH